MWTKAGMPGSPPHDLRYSPHLVLAFTCPAWPDRRNPGSRWSARCRPGAPRWTSPGTGWDPDRRRVLVSVGTLAMDMAEGFFGRVTARSGRWPTRSRPS